MMLGISILSSSVLLWLSQPPVGLWWLGPVALAPWFWALAAAPGAIRGVTSGLLVGSLSGFLVASWMVAGVKSLGASPMVAALGGAGVAFFAAGVPWGLLGGAVALALRTPLCQSVVLCAVAAVAVDAARGAIGVPWALLGHSQASASGVAQIAALGGVPLISGLLVAMSAALVLALRSPRRIPSRRLASSLACVYLGFLALGVPLVERLRPVEAPSGAQTIVLAVQTDIPVGDRWQPLAQRSNLESAVALTEAAMGPARPDLVVWPETLLTTPLERDPALESGLLEAVDRIGVPLVLGLARSGRSGDPALYRNSALRFLPTFGLVAAVDKTRAIPVAESGGGVWSAPWLIHLAGLSGVERRVELGQHEVPLHGDPELALVFCYEVVFPDLVDARRTPASRAVVQIANDTWFATEAVSRQMLAYGSFRAVEQRLPLLRVAHGGGSALVDPLGRIVEMLPFDRAGTLRAELRYEPPPSLREMIGLLGLGALSGLVPLLPGAMGRMLS